MNGKILTSISVFVFIGMLISLFLPFIGIEIDPSYYDLIGSLFGAYFAVVAALVFQVIVEKRKYKETESNLRYLLDKEINYNYDLCVKRILNKNPITQLKNFSFTKYISHVEISDKNKEFIDDLNRLFQDVSSEGLFSINFQKFHEKVYIQQNKKNLSYQELKDIILQDKINTVFEFKILRDIINFTIKYKLDSLDSFEAFNKVLEDSKLSENTESNIILFVTELTAQVFFSNKRVFHNPEIYKSNSLEQFELNESNTSEVLEKGKNISKDLLKIFSNELKVLEKFDISKESKLFVANLPESYKDYDINKMKKLAKELQDFKHEHHYLVGLGIESNGDDIDNNCRSRIKEVEAGSLDHYDCRLRYWYTCASNDQGNNGRITEPYFDSSLSRIFSGVKKVYDEDIFLGVVATDFLIDVSKVNPEKLALSVFTERGDVIYDFNNDMKKNISEKFNVNILNFVKNNKSGNFAYKGNEKNYYFNNFFEGFIMLLEE